jgi:hypothetical protein
LLIVGGVFAVQALSKRHDSTASAPVITAGAPAAAAVEAGIYRADFGAASNVDGGPIAGAGRETATWGCARSATPLGAWRRRRA